MALVDQGLVQTPRSTKLLMQKAALLEVLGRLPEAVICSRWGLGKIFSMKTLMMPWSLFERPILASSWAPAA